MAQPSKKDVVRHLLDKHGRTYCDELGIDIGKNTPSPLFRWLVASLLFSTRIGAGQAVKAAGALSDAGWTTPEKMAEATWKQRVDVLNKHGYARYDESTSRMLEDTSRHLLDKYDGDLRRLREQADGDEKHAVSLLTEFKGIGETGAHIFLREAQTAWDEFYPFADKRALKAAGKIGLDTDAKALSKLVPRKDFPRLVTGLLRADLAGDLETIADEAA